MKVSGVIKRVLYKAPNNGNYMVFFAMNENDEVKIAASVNGLYEGDFINAEGNYKENEKYGKTFHAENIYKGIPDQIQYFSVFLSTSIKGIGTVVADRIVDRFGADTFNIMEYHPDRVAAEIPRVTIKKAQYFSEQIKEQRSLVKEHVLFYSLGISANCIQKIMDIYGSRASEIVTKHPYHMIGAIPNIGFKKADEIARRSGISAKSSERVQNGMLYQLKYSAGSGHVFLPRAELAESTAKLLGVSFNDVDSNIDLLCSGKKAVNENGNIYLSKFYKLECAVADKLAKLVSCGTHMTNEYMERDIRSIEKEKGIILDSVQREGVIMAVKNPVSVITGGPGTGKTTVLDLVISAMIRFGIKKDRIKLVAPTGKAAKRMTQQTGMEASTVHRMVLTIDRDNARNMNDDDPLGSENDDIQIFGELDADVVIADETSMVSLDLAHMLLSVIKRGTKVLFVGDIDQLPSIGAGQFLKDLIDCGRIPVCRLTKIFRQAENNMIIQNAHRINKKLKPECINDEFFLCNRTSADKVIEGIKELFSGAMSRRFGISNNDIQILCPTRKGDLGTNNLNIVMQEFLNPPDKNKEEWKAGNQVFREHDRVIHIKNDYNIEYVEDHGENWKEQGFEDRYGSYGMGVFNGEVGIIEEINKAEDEVIILYDDKKAFYTLDQMKELELAYAMTIHKSQGSEYPTVIMPILTTGVDILYNKNLIYTAVTRAKLCVAMLGSMNALTDTINKDMGRRHSLLSGRIKAEIL